MPKINVYLPNELAGAVRDAHIPVSAVCQAALERALHQVTSARRSDQAPRPGTPAVGLFARFTPRARHALELAGEASAAASQSTVDTEHILLGLVAEGGSVALKVIASLDVELEDVKQELLASMNPAPSAAPGSPPFAPFANQALEATVKEALGLGHNYIGCEHLLLGLLGTEEGLASQVLRRLGLELKTTRRAVVTSLSGFGHQHEPMAAGLTPDTRDSRNAMEEVLARLEAIEERLAG